MRKKVIFIESSNEMGGVEFSTVYLTTHLDKEIWAVMVVCPGEGKLASACRNAGVQVEIIRMPRLLSTSFRLGKADTRFPNLFAWILNGFATLVAANRLWLVLGKEKPDLVVTKGIYAHLSGGMAARQVKIKCIWHLQDYISERLGGFYRAAFGLLARILPEEIVVDGSSIARQLPGDIQDRVHVVWNGVDMQVFRPGIDGEDIRRQFGIRQDELVVGHAARITPWKGQHYLLEAFGQIAFRYPKVRLLLVGAPTFDNGTYDKKLHTRTTELGLNDRVVFAGFRADLPQVLSAMDIFVYPSVEKDTSPLALLSAMGCGLPIVAFDIEGVREVLGDDGLLMPVRDEVKLAEALERLIENAAVRKKMGVCSREKALARFGLEQYVAGMEAVFLSGRQ